MESPDEATGADDDTVVDDLDDNLDDGIVDDS